MIAHETLEEMLDAADMRLAGVQLPDGENAARCSEALEWVREAKAAAGKVLRERDDAARELESSEEAAFDLTEERDNAQYEHEGRGFTRAIDLLLDVRRGVFTLDEVLRTLTNERSQL